MRKVGSLLLARAMLGGVSVAAGAGCGVEAEQPATLTQIVPASAYNDAQIAISLLGGPFRPPIDVDTHSGAAAVADAPYRIFLDPGPPVDGRHGVDAIETSWRRQDEIDARIPVGLPPGDYGVGMRDPRGHLVPSHATFTSLGADIDPPRITFLEPPWGTTFAPGAKVVVNALIDDGPGHVSGGSWSVRSSTLGSFGTTCDPDPTEPGQLPCVFQFYAPLAPTDIFEPIDIRVDARDSLQHDASGSLRINVAWSPIISTVTPSIGPTIGGTPISVQGSRLIVDLSQIIIDGQPVDSMVDRIHETIRAVTPPHVPGTAALAVSNGESASASIWFTFIAPPRIRLISPTRAPADQEVSIMVAGNYFRPETRFFWVEETDGGDVAGDAHAVAATDASAPLPAPPFSTYVNEHRVALTLAPGSGTIALIARDDVSGDDMLAHAFTYDPPP